MNDKSTICTASYNCQEWYSKIILKEIVSDDG